MNITDINQQFQSGATNIEQHLKATLEKLEDGNKSINAATDILHREATVQLQNLTDGSLKGIPFSIKECYALAGKTITSASKRMPPIECKEDAVVVRKLKQAGAIPVARGNTSEFLLGRETNNLLYGTTNNAINPKLTAGGSSGGDAALVAAGLVAFGIGTDIGGSCRYPAVFNGIVGFKPASGQIGKEGIFPSVDGHYAETMNSPGIMCTEVSDARLVYNVIGNKVLKADPDISQAKIYTSNTFKVKIEDDSIKRALAHSIAFLKSKSFAKISDLKIPESGELHYDYTNLMGDVFIDKIYEWSRTSDGKTLSVFSELLNRLKGKPTVSNEIFKLLPGWNLIKPSKSKTEKTIAKVNALRSKYDDMLSSDGVLVLPTIGILAPKHGKFIPRYNKPGIVKIITPIQFCNVLNLSCITLPARKFQKNASVNPPGIQLVVRAGNEEMLLNVAEALEKEIG